MSRASPFLPNFPLTLALLFIIASLLLAAPPFSHALPFTQTPNAAPADNASLPARSALPSAESYHVDGARIPGVSEYAGDLGDSWAGLMPLSRSPSVSKAEEDADGEKPGDDDQPAYFFWYWPNSEEAGKDDVVFWFNGGPGCSSLEGLLQENGPFTVTEPSRGVYAASRSAFSWTRLSTVVWVEQPLGTGFSQAGAHSNSTSSEGTYADEGGVAQDFYAFLRSFFEVFPALRGKRVWLAGESYAGVYIPYIADYIYEQNDSDSGGGALALELDLRGIALLDPYLVPDPYGQEAIHSRWHGKPVCITTTTASGRSSSTCLIYHFPHGCPAGKSEFTRTHHAEMSGRPWRMTP